MKKLLLASALALGAGLASAETIVLDNTPLNTDDDRQTEFTQAVTINTLTEEVCIVTGSGKMWSESGMTQNCELFQEKPDFVQANLLAALEATGHTWRPTVPEDWKDQAGDIADSALQKWNDWRNKSE